MAGPGDHTLVENAVHNPAEPRHFMRLVPAGTTRRAVAAGETVVESDAATVVKEVGRDIYDPVVYFPRADVNMEMLVRIDKSTHCPLKGDTEYFDLVIGDTTINEAAWSYVDMVDGAEALQHLVAFDSSKVEVS